MVLPKETFCPITGVSHQSITTRGCPHCLMDFRPDEVPLSTLSMTFYLFTRIYIIY